MTPFVRSPLESFSSEPNGHQRRSVFPAFFENKQLKLGLRFLLAATAMAVTQAPYSRGGVFPLLKDSNSPFPTLVR